MLHFFTHILVSLQDIYFYNIIQITFSNVIDLMYEFIIKFIWQDEYRKGASMLHVGYYVGATRWFWHIICRFHLRLHVFTR